MNVVRRRLMPALLAMVTGSSMHAGPYDTHYRIENRTSGALILSVHAHFHGGSIALRHGSVAIPYTPTDQGWVIPAGCNPMLSLRHPGKQTLPFSLRPLASGMDLRSVMRFSACTLSPRPEGGLDLDRTIVVSGAGLLEVGTEESSKSLAPADCSATVSPQMSRTAMTRALAHASSRPSYFFRSSEAGAFPMPDCAYLAPHVGLGEPTLRVLNVGKEMLICLTFEGPVQTMKPLRVYLFERHPDGGSDAFDHPTAMRFLEGSLNEYFFVAPPHRAGTVKFHVQDPQLRTVGQVVFTYPKDHQVSPTAPAEPMSEGTEPRVESKEREVKRPWDAPLAAAPGGEGKEAKDPAGPGAKRARAAAPALHDADPVAEPEPPSSLLRRLPGLLRRHVASFDANAFRGVNREFRDHARSTATRFTVPATMKNDDLIAFMTVNRGIRHITCLQSKVTSAGLERALDANTALETIEIVDDKVHAPDRIERILNAHPRLRVFALNDKSPVTAALLGRLNDKTRLRELRICGNGVDRLDFSSFSSLAKLHIQHCALPDAFLPNGLTDLSIAHCAEFTGRDAAFRLHAFATDRLDLFDGFGNHPLLESLTAGRPGAPFSVHGDREQQNLLGFIQGCSALTRLTLSGSFGHAFRAGLPQRLTHLNLEAGATRYDPATQGNLEFRHLSRLVSLQISYFQNIYDLHLPLALEQLSLQSGSISDIKTLPASLEKISLRDVDTKGQWLPPRLTHLEIQSCDRFTPTRMADLLRRLNQLRTLDYSGWKRGELDPAEFEAHPTLQQAHTKRLIHSDPWRVWQAGSGKSASLLSGAIAPMRRP